MASDLSINERKTVGMRALWHKWDPIGVFHPADSDWPDDEYDAYLAPCLELLERRGSIYELTNYLSYVVVHGMGLGGARSSLEQFAREMVSWYEATWRIRDEV